MDVKKITRKYSILEFDGMDEELTNRLSSYHTSDETTGFSYCVSAVDADPGEKAKEYVEQYSKQELEANLKMNARKFVDAYSNNYEEAVLTEVVEGKCSELDAILKIDSYKDHSFNKQMDKIESLREKGFITDKEARQYTAPVLEMVGSGKQLKLNDSKKENFDRLYTEEEDE